MSLSVALISVNAYAHQTYILDIYKRGSTNEICLTKRQRYIYKEKGGLRNNNDSHKRIQEDMLQSEFFMKSIKEYTLQITREYYKYN